MEQEGKVKAIVSGRATVNVEGENTKIAVGLGCKAIKSMVKKKNHISPELICTQSVSQF